MTPDTTEELTRLTERLRALAEPNRLRLIAQLCEESRSCGVGELAACCPVDLSVVSRHLKALRDAGFVTAEKQGREVRYCCDRTEIVTMLRDLANWIENCCAGPGATEKGGTS